MPYGVNYLFYSANDTLYGDNADPEGDFQLRVTSLECRQPSGRLVVWEGHGNGASWHDPANWSPPGIPEACDDVVINGPLALVGWWLSM